MYFACVIVYCLVCMFVIMCNDRYQQFKLCANGFSLLVAMGAHCVA